MNINELKAAREEYNGSLYPHTEGRFAQANMVSEETVHIIRTLLDQAINAPDLESLKREVVSDIRNTPELLHKALGYSMEEVVGHVIDHLAPRIVREGFVVVPEEPTQAMKDAGANERLRQERNEELNTHLIYKAMIAASKGD
jgi:hypothetical protein